MDTAKIFEKLLAYKGLPTYQFERRFDPFMLPCLEAAFNNFMEAEFQQRKKKPDFKLLYPEFPLMRIHDQAADNKASDYADYLLWSVNLNQILLVEFKTEDASLTEKQFLTYAYNCKVGWPVLVDFYLDKAIGNTKYWKKFVYGLLHISREASYLTGNLDQDKLAEFLKPKSSKGVHDFLGSYRKEIKRLPAPEIKFAFLAPTISVSKLQKMADKYPDNYEYYVGCLSLHNFAKVTETPLKELLQEVDKERNSGNGNQ